jgi:hypothetical protein
MRAILGVDKVYDIPQKGAYAYYVGGENGIYMLKQILPYLVVKRDKVILAIEQRKQITRKPYKQTNNGIASL